MDSAAIEKRIRDSFARQAFMATVGARMATVRAGHVEIELPYAAGNTQQHGFIHGGLVASIADSACGYAALTTMPEDAAVLTAEFKINLMSPATGDMLRAVGRVVRPGRRLVICSGDVFAIDKGEEKHVALITATMAVVRMSGDLRD
ncbi:MAG: PaaI family thioesterase [Pseudolabrys sp.]|nr:PaaI family thioesterase [Pseudolabrys sp.]